MCLFQSLGIYEKDDKRITWVPFNLWGHWLLDRWPYVSTKNTSTCAQRFSQRFLLAAVKLLRTPSLQEHLLDKHKRLLWVEEGAQNPGAVLSPRSLHLPLCSALWMSELFKTVILWFLIRTIQCFLPSQNTVITKPTIVLFCFEITPFRAQS